MTSYQWNPTTDYIEGANVTRLARAHSLAGIAELRSRSVADTAWYWGAVATDLGLRFRTPYSRVLDMGNGIEHPDWFVGATMNIVDSCLLRWRDEAPDRVAVVHEDEAGRIREVSFSELAERSCPCGKRSARTGDRARRCCRDLPADDPRSSRRVLRGGCSRSHSGTAVLRFRLDGDRVQACRRGRQGGHRGRCHHTAGTRAAPSTASR